MFCPLLNKECIGMDCAWYIQAADRPNVTPENTACSIPILLFQLKLVRSAIENLD